MKDKEESNLATVWKAGVRYQVIFYFCEHHSNSMHSFLFEKIKGLCQITYNVGHL